MFRQSSHRNTARACNAIGTKKPMKDTPPKPVFWQEQLGISDQTKLDGPKLAGEMNKLITPAAK